MKDPYYNIAVDNKIKIQRGWKKWC